MWENITQDNCFFLATSAIPFFIAELARNAKKYFFNRVTACAMCICEKNRFRFYQEVFLNSLQKHFRVAKEPPQQKKIQLEFQDITSRPFFGAQSGCKAKGNILRGCVYIPCQKYTCIYLQEFRRYVVAALIFCVRNTADLVLALARRPLCLFCQKKLRKKTISVTKYRYYE